MQTLENLLNLQFVFWSGWIVSAAVFLSFVIGLILDIYSKKKIFLQSAATVLSHFNSSKIGFSRASMLVVFALFSVAFINRYWLSRFIFGPWFFADEALEDCIGLFQLSRGESIWGGNTNYLVWLSYLIAYRLFGFGVEVARLTNILFFAISVVIVYWALHRPFGQHVCWFVVGMMLLSSPLIAHSMYATSINFSLLPTAIILWILTRPLSWGSAGFLGIVPVAGLYLYPGAFLTGICLILLHTIFFDRSWPWRTRCTLLVTFAASGGLAYLFRLALSGNSTWKHSWTQWAGGHMSFEQIGQNSIVMLKDTFWESVSFNALNSGAPYIDTVIVGLLIIGVVSSLILAKSQPSLMFDRKWIWISLLSFVGSVFLSGFAAHYPGVRRIFSSLPLLFLIAGLGLKHFWQWKAFRPFLGGAVIVCFSLVASRSYAIGQKDWPSLRYFSRLPDFMVGARETLLQTTNSQKNIVIIAYDSDQWSGELYRCALSLDERLNTHFQSVIVIPRSGLNLKQDVQGEFMLLANELFSENQLQDIFGQPPTSSKIRKFSKTPQPDDLIAIYEFTSDSVPSVATSDELSLQSTEEGPSS
jgi:hypothetical protein